MPSLRRILRTFGLALILVPLPAAWALYATFGTKMRLAPGSEPVAVLVFRPTPVVVDPNGPPLLAPGRGAPARARTAFVLAYAGTMAGGFLLLGSLLARPGKRLSRSGVDRRSEPPAGP
ncbi:MAG TPA: hypothetical protein VFI25_20000 [Planctomycetota bacterium]|nr:hypothetical protein [Planctomycetota bacterium]